MPDSDNRPWIVPVGGFLGAGKTSLILAAARILQSRGLRTAVVLNDQGHDLVDTAYSTVSGIAAGEVTGACFCCRFSDLISTANRLRALSPDVIFIEPVGSCTDLAATIVRPLQQDFADQYRIGPLTVLVDPVQMHVIEMGLADTNIKYLIDHQLAEADIIAMSKSDLPGFLINQNNGQIRRLSAVKGSGVAAWLDEVLSGQISSGTATLAIDYQEYAQAEAALAWLNWSAPLHSTRPMFAAQLLGPLFDDLRQAIQASGGTLAHLKMFSQARGSYLKVAATNNHADPVIEGDMTAPAARTHSLRINIRAVLAPETLEQLFRLALSRVPATWSSEHLQCFSPGKPIPERRVPA